MDRLILGGTNVAGIAVPAAIGAGVGALTFWLAQETLKQMVVNKPWVAPVLGSIVGLGAGAFIGYQFFRR